MPPLPRLRTGRGTVVAALVAFAYTTGGLVVLVGRPAAAQGSEYAVNAVYVQFPRVHPRSWSGFPI